MAQEEAKFTEILKDGDFEIRKYESRVVAETTVDAGFEEAGNQAFNRLFGYISGQNTSKTEIAMTAPVTQQKVDGKYRVAIILPAKYNISNTPAPANSNIRIVAEPETYTAVVTYSGNWSKINYDKNLTRLKDWAESQHLTPKSDPVWARYNQPLPVPVFRRNEIIIPITEDNVYATH